MTKAIEPKITHIMRWDDFEGQVIKSSGVAELVLSFDDSLLSSRSLKLADCLPAAEG